MNWAPPTPEEQVIFLRNVQRLLAEGQFVASYKFALLHVLADLCVLRGDDTGAPLELGIDEIDIQLARHMELESELKSLKAGIKQMDKQQDELVAAVRPCRVHARDGLWPRASRCGHGTSPGRDSVAAIPVPVAPRAPVSRSRAEVAAVVARWPRVAT